MYWLKVFLKIVILPPTSLVLAAVLGTLLWRRYVGRLLIAAALVLYLVLAMPATGLQFFAWLAQSRALSDGDLEKTEAIVLLTAGMYSNAPEYGGVDTVNDATLFRARYAAWLHRRSGLPILVVGGRLVASETTEAAAAAHVLREEFRVPVRWSAGKGRDTIESAAAVREVLRPLNVRSLAVVTSAVHMSRAEIAFRNEGFEVFPAPTGLDWRKTLGFRDFLPSASGMWRSSDAIKEWLGRLWTLVLG